LCEAGQYEKMFKGIETESAIKDDKLEFALLPADCLTADRGSSATGLPFSKDFKRKEVDRLKACEHLLIKFHSGQLIHVLNSAKKSKDIRSIQKAMQDPADSFGGRIEV
jgi:hypothetical protein